MSALALLPLSILLGAGLSSGLLRNAPIAWTFTALAFSAGALLTVLVEEIVPQAHEGHHTRASAATFRVGFGLFVALSILFD